MRNELIYKRWSLYRETLCDIILESLHLGKPVFIAGAGNLNDIAVKRILEITGKMLLTDIDVHAVISGLRLQKIESNGIEVKKIELTGLDNSEFFSEVNGFIVKRDFIRLRKYLETYNLNEENYCIGERFDNVLLSPVYTQLLLPQFLDISAQNAAIEILMEFIGKVIHKVNKSILLLANTGARICIWSDILEYANDDPALSDIVSHISDEKWMDGMYESYLAMYGHGLGSYGILDMRKMVSVSSEKWLLWPFIESRTMLVKIISATYKG